LHIRAVLFDLDGTLLDRRSTFRRHIELMIGRHPKMFGCGVNETLVNELLELDRNGFADRREFYSSVERHLGLAAGSGSILHRTFEEYFPESCVPMSRVTDTLDSLRERGVKVGLITNGRALMQNRKVDGLGIRPHLDSVVISDDLGVRKPDRRIFAAALEGLAVAASSAAYVGDNPEADVFGAKRSGMFAVWRRDQWWPEPKEADLVIDDLSQLIPGLFERSASD
jgi:putative hydrolase of the HAD superfamily